MAVFLSFALFCISLAANMARRKAKRRENAGRFLLKDTALRPEAGPGFVFTLREIAAAPPAWLRRFLLPLSLSLALLAFTRNLILALAVWPVSIAVKRWIVSYRMRRSQIKKEEYVLEFVDSLNQSLRSGLSLQQSLEVSSEDVGEEMREEILAVLKDLHLGGGLEESLMRAAEGSASPSLRLSYTVLALLHTKGGDLPRILERLRKRVAEGLEVRREARILTAQSRASGYLVSALPPVFLLLQAVLNPHSLSPLISTPMGNMIIAVAAALNMAAFLLVRKMVNPGTREI